MTGQQGAATWEANAGPQKMFLRCPAYEVLYGGAAGGGKSDALLIDAIDQCDKPRYRALLIRRSFPELRELIDRSRNLYPIAFPGSRYSESDKCWRFPSGARVEFGYLERDADVYRYQGQEFSYLGFDEVTHYSEWAYLWLLSRNRSTDKTIKCYVRATTNPGGPGHNWVRSRFVDPAKPLTEILDETTGTCRVFIPAKLSDNPHLAVTDYGLRLLALPDADKRALLDGDWDAYSGSVFKLEPNIHVISWGQFREITGHEYPPKGWTRFRSMDWGYARPFSIGWWACDFEGRLYRYREWYGVARDSKGKRSDNVGLRLEPERVAEKIVAIEAEERKYIGLGDADKLVFNGVADPACWSKGQGDHGGGPSITEAMAKHGVIWLPAKNDRISGKMEVHNRLDYEINDKGDVIERPGVMVLDECRDSIITIPALEYDKHRVEDVDSDMEDHAYDDWRYCFMNRPWMPKAPKKPAGWRDQNRNKTGWV